MQTSANPANAEWTGSNQAYRRIEVEPLAGALGAEIHGVNLAQTLDDETVEEIQRALLEHLAIFFRDQQLSVEQHKAFSRRFGTLNVHPQYVPLDGDPEIFPVVKDPTDSSPKRSTRSQDLPLYDPPSVELQSRCEDDQVFVTVRGLDQPATTRWQATGAIHGEGLDVLRRHEQEHRLRGPRRRGVEV